MKTVFYNPALPSDIVVNSIPWYRCYSQLATWLQPLSSSGLVENFFKLQTLTLSTIKNMTKVSKKQSWLNAVPPLFPAFQTSNFGVVARFYHSRPVEKKLPTLLTLALKKNKFKLVETRRRREFLCWMLWNLFKMPRNRPGQVSNSERCHGTDQGRFQTRTMFMKLESTVISQIFNISQVLFSISHCKA